VSITANTEILSSPVLTRHVTVAQLVAAANYKTYKVTQGAEYAETRTKAAADITQEMLQDGSWKTAKFKPYNFNALGQVVSRSHCSISLPCVSPSSCEINALCAPAFLGPALSVIVETKTCESRSALVMTTGGAAFSFLAAPLNVGVEIGWKFRMRFGLWKFTHVYDMDVEHQN
jgi:hypothetical protein